MASSAVVLLQINTSSEEESPDRVLAIRIIGGETKLLHDVVTKMPMAYCINHIWYMCVKGEISEYIE
uniref:Ovule protein n=1 Tax=Syphacia muris TaxID=451379 RepID=A0A0N5AZD2_9BILA